MPPRISYSLTRRPSQSRIAAIYQQAIKENYQLVADQDTADIVILHHLPQHYNSSYLLHPALRRKYVVSCCIAHAEDIPESWKRGLALVQEVWTCSRFCQAVLSAIHPCVQYIPYPIQRDLGCRASVLEAVKRMLAFDRDDIHFLTIGSLGEGRKNVRGLVCAFREASTSMPNAKLVIKATPDEHADWPRDDRIIFLPIALSDDYVNALYQICDVYVSAHHCESWGLCLSDALIAGMPVVATAYSGNMDFIDEDSAFPVRYMRTRVKPGENGPDVDCGVWWATPDQNHLAERIAETYADFHNARLETRLAHARCKIRKFDTALASKLICERLSAIEGGFGG